MKKLLFVIALSFLSFSIFSKESDVVEETPTTESELSTTTTTSSSSSSSSSVKASKPGLSEIPDAKRPRAIDSEKAKKAAEKDESEEDEEEHLNTIKYGLPSEISELLDKLITNDDPRFTQEIYDLFQVTKNSTIKEKILKYFTKQEDPCLEDYAVELLNDPYDEKADVVKASFK